MQNVFPNLLLVCTATDTPVSSWFINPGFQCYLPFDFFTQFNFQNSFSSRSVHLFLLSTPSSLNSSISPSLTRSISPKSMLAHTLKPGFQKRIRFEISALENRFIFQFDSLSDVKSSLSPSPSPSPSSSSSNFSMFHFFFASYFFSSFFVLCLFFFLILDR